MEKKGEGDKIQSPTASITERINLDSGLWFAGRYRVLTCRYTNTSDTSGAWQSPASSNQSSVMIQGGIRTRPCEIACNILYMCMWLFFSEKGSLVFPCFSKESKTPKRWQATALELYIWERPWWEVVQPSFYKWGNWGPKRSKSSLKITQLIHGRAEPSTPFSCFLVLSTEVFKERKGQALSNEMGPQFLMEKHFPE